MGKVILAFPRTSFDTPDNIDVPMSVVAVATYVAREHDVRVMDQRVEMDWTGWLAREMAGTSPLCVGISSMTGPQIGHALEIAAKCRELDPDVPIIWGGVHATLMPEQTLEHRLVDYVAVGDAEESFRAFVAALAQGKRPTDIPGIGYKEQDGTPRVNGKAAMLELETLPSIPFELVNIENYVNSQGIYSSGQKERGLGFLTARGCPFRCTYCAQPVLSGRRFRTMSPELAVRRLMEVVEKHRLTRVSFIDEEFFAQPKRGQRIGALIGGALKWTVQTRASDLLRVDLKGLEANGLIGVQPGVETGSDRIRELIHKDETVGQVIDANREVAKTGIVAAYNMMMGFPGETWEDLMHSVDLGLRLVRDNPRAMITNFNKLVPLPGSEMFTAARTRGFTPPASLEGWVTFSRQQLEWTGGDVPKERLAAIMFTARFVDGWRIPRRLATALGARHPLPLLFRLAGPYFRWRWQHHRFDGRLACELNKVVIKALTR